MPIKKLIRTPADPALNTLCADLIDEWRNPDASADQPIIIEEGDGVNAPLHLYVIWDAWRDVDSIDRSKIVMDAFEAVHGATRASKVTRALGLTTNEAQRMRLQYQ